MYQFPWSDGGRRVVWVDPATGLPIQSAVYEQSKDKGETQVMALGIVPNAARPTQGLSFEPPPGYAVIHRDRTPQTSIGVGSGTSGQESAGVLLALNIEDRAILLCWTHYTRANGEVVETDLDGAVGRLLPLRVESTTAGIGIWPITSGLIRGMKDTMPDGRCSFRRIPGLASGMLVWFCRTSG